MEISYVDDGAHITYRNTYSWDYLFKLQAAYSLSAYGAETLVNVGFICVRHYLYMQRQIYKRRLIATSKATDVASIAVDTR